MECLNPFCSKKGIKFKTQRGLNRHLYYHKHCLSYFTQTHNKNKNVNEQYNTYNHTFYHSKNDPTTKRLCTEKRYNNDLINNNTNNDIPNANNIITNNTELLLFDNYFNFSDNDDNSIDDTYSFDSQSTLSSNDSYLNDDECLQHEQVLGNIYTCNQRCMNKLIKILEDMNCPDTAVTKIMNWAREAYMEGFEFKPPSKTRHGNMQWMIKW